jgi:DnaJ domain/Transmembrane Fragile-X-F protein
MRLDLSFFLCCCRSFLGTDDGYNEDGSPRSSFYELLGLERDASPDDIKRAYKRQAVRMHPDKLAQRGQAVTSDDQAQFTRMKEAYEVLSDPHKRETYDAIGERGLKWLEEPFSIDPQELAHNFATSSALDRSKVFAIFVAVAIAALCLPVLVCLHVDGSFGEQASWMATLIPLWLWNAFIVFYHVRVILMGPIPRPEHIPEKDWVDPLPMKKRIFSFARFLLIVLFELLVALKLDGTITAGWAWVCIPLYLWEATTLYKKLPLARMRIVTVEDLEIALNKPFAQFTAAEKDLIGKRYSVVPSITSPDFDVAQKLKARARQDITKSLFRIAFVLIVLVQLDTSVELSWWVVFAPFWFMTCLMCLANYQAFVDIQREVLAKDPTLLGPPTGAAIPPKKDVETGEHTANSDYASMDLDGTAPDPVMDTMRQEMQNPGGEGPVPPLASTTSKPDASSTQATPPSLTEQERDELKAHFMAGGYRFCAKCCTQGFVVFIVLLLVIKLQGAGFSAFWIISPFLLFVSF